MFKFLQSMFGKKEVAVKQPEFHEEIRAQVEAAKSQPFPAEDPAPDTLVKSAKKPAAKKASAKKAPAKPAEKKPAKKPAKKSK